VSHFEDNKKVNVFQAILHCFNCCTTDKVRCHTVVEIRVFCTYLHLICTQSISMGLLLFKSKNYRCCPHPTCVQFPVDEDVEDQIWFLENSNELRLLPCAACQDFPKGKKSKHPWDYLSLHTPGPEIFSCRKQRHLEASPVQKQRLMLHSELQNTVNYKIRQMLYCELQNTVI